MPLQRFYLILNFVVRMFLFNYFKYFVFYSLLSYPHIIYFKD